MEECLTYFRVAIACPHSVPPWSEWWAANEERVSQVFSLVDYVRLKHRRLFGAQQILKRAGEPKEALVPPHPYLAGSCSRCGERTTKSFEATGSEVRCPLCGVIDSFKYLNLAELEAGLEEIRSAPQDEGVLKLIVCRPQTEQRIVLEEAALDLIQGLLGDNWRARGSSPEEEANLDTQINIMNARAIALIAQDQERWHLAGDQLFVEMDLSLANLPAGTQLAIGEAVLEVTAVPHTGCKKFTQRFGLDAMKFVNSPVGRQLNLRGINAKVIQAGKIRVGDGVRKIIRDG